MSRREEAWRELSPLLDEVLSLEGDARERWLTELATSAPTVERALRGLLDDDARLESGGFLSPHAYADLFGPTPSLTGQQVGAWVLERPLGHGGMGTVWLARRSDGRFEGTAAVKLLNVSLLGRGGEGEARFRREGSMLARLSHPNIARLLDAGIAAGGQPYLVLEHVEGERIDRWCEARRLGLPARLSLFTQVLDAVGHAHASLIVHRDLKPANILVTPGPAGTDGVVKLLDFGIATLLDAEEEGSGERSSITLPGGRALTPDFAAPEQVLGDAVTTATDVYALGVLLYVLLSGRHPTAEGCRTPADVIRALSEVEPAQLGLRDLDSVLGKALRKAPAERYQTVAAFAEDIARYVRHQPVTARRDSLAYRTRMFVRRNRVVVGASAVVAASLCGATAFSVAQMRDARRQRDAAVYEKARADAQVEFQYLLLSGIGTAQITMREIVDQGTVLLEREYAGDPRVAASIAIALSDQYSELGENQRQADLLSRAESLAVRAGAMDLVLRTRCNRAINLQKRDHAAHADALLDSIRAALPAVASTDVAWCLEALAEAEIRANRFDSAAALGRRAATMLEGLGETRGMQYLGALNTEANALENAKHRREALAIYQRIGDVLDSTGRGAGSGRIVIRNNIGIALSNLGEMTTAEPILYETVDAFRRTNPAGDVHPAILINYCRTALFLRKLDSAGVWYERLARQSAARGDAAMQEDGAYGMAEVELLRGRLAEAARWIAEEKRANARLSSPRPANGPALDAAMARARGEVAAARAGFQQALRALGYFEGKRPYQMRSVLIQAAEAALDAVVPREALEYARAAHGIATSDSLTETRSAYVGEARLLEGRALLAAGDSSGARASLARAVVALRAGAGAEHPRTRETETLLSALPR